MRGHRSVLENVCFMDRYGSIEVFFPAINPAQNRRNRKDLERAAHGKSLIEPVADDIHRSVMKDRCTDSAAALGFEFRQPAVNGIGWAEGFEASSRCGACSPEGEQG